MENKDRSVTEMEIRLWYVQAVVLSTYKLSDIFLIQETFNGRWIGGENFRAIYK